MTIKEAHYHFKVYFDRIDTSTKPDFNEAEIDYFLNEAQLVFIRQRYNVLGNKYQKGFEQTQNRTDDLSTLVIQLPVQPPITPVLVSPGVYEVNLSNLVYPYLHYVGGYTITSTPSCNIKAPIRIVTHDNVEELNGDPFELPAYHGVRAVFARSTDLINTSLYIYSSNPVLEVNIAYLKHPTRVSTGNYTYLDGITYPQATFELPLTAHDQIVNTAVTLAAHALENPNEIQLKLSKINIQE